LNIKSVEKKEKSEVEIIVEVSPEEFESAIGKAFIKNKGRISVPGFRKGKAPRKIIERMYGASVFHPDALDLLLPEVMDFVKKESGQKIVGYPQASNVDIKDDSGGADITVTASVYPEVKIGEYKGLSAVKPDAEIPESSVDAEIAGVRLRNARIETVDRPAKEGDTAVINFEGFVDGEPFEGGKGENHELELGSKAFIPGFEDKVAGMVKGESRDIDLVFPDDYPGKLAGKPVVFKVTLTDVKEKLLPDLDDEFAKDVSEFDTLEDYKTYIRDRLRKVKQEEVDAAFENSLLNLLVESMEADVPEAMIEEQMDLAAGNFARQVSAYGMDPSSYLQMMNMTPDMFRENIRISSEKQVKSTLALEKIAELENIVPSEDDIEKEYIDAAARFGVEPDKLKESVEKDKVILEIKARRATKLVAENAIAEKPAEAAGDKAEKPAAKPKRQAAKKAVTESPDSEIPEPAPADSSAKAGEQSAEEAAAPVKKARKPAAKKPKGDETE